MRLAGSALQQQGRMMDIDDRASDRCAIFFAVPLLWFVHHFSVSRSANAMSLSTLSNLVGDVMGDVNQLISRLWPTRRTTLISLGTIGLVVVRDGSPCKKKALSCVVSFLFRRLAG